MYHTPLNKKHLLPWLLLLLVLVLAACGAPTREPSSSNATGEAANNNLQEWLNEQGNVELSDVVTEATEPEDAADVIATTTPTAVAGNTPTTETAPATTGLAVDAATQTTDANGIPIGYTKDGRPFKGNPNASIVMEEFSDFQCPYCARWADQTLPSLLANQIANGEVVLVYYDFPLSSIHPQAQVAANAARCAGEQGAVAYWQFHDQLFKSSDQWANNNANTSFVSIAEELGLNTADFQTCVESNRHNDAIQTDVNLGTSRGVGSTPSFFLNGQMLVGAHPPETFNQAITALLNGESIAAAQPQAQPQTQEIVLPTPAAIPLETDKVAFSMGDPDAPVQIVEYTDYQCPFCQQHATQTMPRMMTEMVANGRVHYILKDLPLDQLHPNARAAAKAARCAGEQDAHQEMHDALFGQQERWINATGDQVGATFADMAGDLGLDPETFTTCFESDRLDALIQANVDEALALGVNSTPSFFINGYMLRGAQPYEVFEQVVGWGENGELEAQIEASIRASLAAQQAQQQQPQEPAVPTGPVDVPTENSFAIGSPDAPITVVEYTDFQCPFCSRHFTETYPQMKEAYVDTGIVRYVFKDFPLTSIHPQAFLAAEAGRCAGEQDAFVEMHDMLFANQGEWNGRADAATLFTGYAEELGLELTTFSECLESHRYKEAIESDVNEGLAFGVRGTPTFFINGNILAGAQPIEAFDQAVQQLQAQQ